MLHIFKPSVVLIMRLEGHNAPRRNPEFEERVPVRYLADVRQEYHTALASKASIMLHISVINANYLAEILKEMDNEATLKSLAVV